MKHFTDDAYLLSAPALKNLISQPPLDVDGFVSRQKDKSIKGAIVLYVDELRSVFVAGIKYAQEQSGNTGIDFNAFMEQNGITI